MNTDFPCAQFPAISISLWVKATVVHDVECGQWLFWGVRERGDTVYPRRY